MEERCGRAAKKMSIPDARWTTIDPLWPMESALVYVGGSPTVFVDPSGLVETLPPLVDPDIELGPAPIFLPLRNPNGSLQPNPPPNCPPAIAVEMIDDPIFAGFWGIYWMFFPNNQSGSPTTQPRRLHHPVYAPIPILGQTLAPHELPLTYDQCDEIHRKYKQVCIQPRSCKRSTPLPNLKANLQTNLQCAALRSIVVSRCDPYRPKNPRPNPNNPNSDYWGSPGSSTISGHLIQICEAMGAAWNCALELDRLGVRISEGTIDLFINAHRDCGYFSKVYGWTNYVPW